MSLMTMLPLLTLSSNGYGTALRRRWGIMAGIAASLALHGLLIFCYRAWLAPLSMVRDAPGSAMTVWLRPALPPAVPTVASSAPALTTQHQPASNNVHQRPARAQALAKAVTKVATVTARQPASLTLLTPARVAPAADAAPVFNMAAALQTARQIASEPDDAKPPDTLAAQLARKPLYPKPTDTALARAIAEGKRPDCKDGVPGGLLAPIFLLMDKKDSGCKW